MVGFANGGAMATNKSAPLELEDLIEPRLRAVLAYRLHSLYAPYRRRLRRARSVKKAENVHHRPPYKRHPEGVYDMDQRVTGDGQQTLGRCSH